MSENSYEHQFGEAVNHNVSLKVSDGQSLTDIYSVISIVDDVLIELLQDLTLRNRDENLRISHVTVDYRDEEGNTTLAFTVNQEDVEAYADGNSNKLSKLLESPLLETFKDAIVKRKKKKHLLELEISRVVSAEVINKRAEKNKDYFTVRFVSDQCLVTRNSRGKILEGDPDQFIEVTDLWTFSRSRTSKTPNWKLVATQVPEN